MSRKTCTIFILIIFLCCIAVSCIYVYEKTHILSSYYPDTSTIVYDVSIDEIEKEMKINKEWLTSYHVLSSLFLTSSERIFLFKCEKDYMEDVKKACKNEIKKLLKQFHNSGEEKKILNAKEYYDETYCIIVISDQAELIMRDIKHHLSL